MLAKKLEERVTKSEKGKYKTRKATTRLSQFIKYFTIFDISIKRTTNRN